VDAEFDSPNSRNSAFTSVLAQAIVMPGKTIQTIMKEVTKKVRDIAQSAQIPQTYANLTDDFYFLKSTVPVSSVTPQPPLASPSSERTEGIATDAGESLRAF
jgi:hypothetical protein